MAADNSRTDILFDTSNVYGWLKEFTATDAAGIPQVFVQVNDDGNVAALQAHGQWVDVGSLGATLGSQIGNVIAGHLGNSLFAHMAVGTLTAAIGNELGRALQNSELFAVVTEALPGTRVVVDQAITAAEADLEPGFSGSLSGAGIGQLSALLMGELTHELGLDGFGGGLVNAVGTTVTAQLVTNLYNIGVNGADPSTVLAGFNAENFITNMEGAVGGYLGSYVAAQIVIPHTQDQAAATAIGSAVGGWLGTAILPGIGTAIGAFFGDLAGGWLSGAFGAADSGGKVWLGGDGHFTDGAFYKDNGGDATPFYNIANTQVSALNALVGFTGAQVDVGASSHTITYIQDGTDYYLFGDNSGSPYGIVDVVYNLYDRNQLTPMVSAGIMNLAHNTHLTGGDPLMVTAWEHSDATNATAFGADLQIAHDYRTYVDNAPVINALMAAEPDSAFTAGWTLTLIRAEALGLNAPVDGTAGNDTMNGLSGHHDLIDAGAGDDVIFGNGGNDTLWGGDGTTASTVPRAAPTASTADRVSTSSTIPALALVSSRIFRPAP